MFIILYLAMITNAYGLLPPTIAGIPWALIAFGIVLLYGLIVLGVKGGHLFDDTRVNWILILYVIYVAFEVVYTAVRWHIPLGESLREGRFFLEYATVFPLLAILKGYSKKKLSASLKMIFGLNYLSTILYAVGSLMHVDLLYSGYSVTLADGVYRQIGSFPPLVIPFVLVSYLYSRSGGRSAFVKSYLYLGLLSIILSFTRGFWLVTFATLVWGHFATRKQAVRSLRRRLLSVSVSSFVLVGALIVLWSYPPLYTRLVESYTGLVSGQGTFSFRMLVLNERVHLINTHNPALGMGFVDSRLGINFSLLYGPVVNGVVGLRDGDIDWATIIAETGWLGVAGITCVLLALGVYLMRTSRSCVGINPFTYSLQYSVGMYCIASLILAFTSSTLVSLASIITCLIAIGYRSYSLQKNDENAHTFRETFGEPKSA